MLNSRKSKFSSAEIFSSLRDDIRSMQYTAKNAHHIMTTPGTKVRQLPGKRVNLMQPLTLAEVK